MNMKSSNLYGISNSKGSLILEFNEFSLVYPNEYMDIIVKAEQQATEEGAGWISVDDGDRQFNVNSNRVEEIVKELSEQRAFDLLQTAADCFVDYGDGKLIPVGEINTILVDSK